MRRITLDKDSNIAHWVIPYPLIPRMTRITLDKDSNIAHWVIPHPLIPQMFLTYMRDDAKFIGTKGRL